MHCRRGFADALKALPANDRSKPCLAGEGLGFCDSLFKVERGLRHSTPNTHIGRAIRYALNYWETLNTFLKDGRLEIDNGASERSIKSFVIGRKGFLFANTPDGAKTSAISYSIVETAKENHLKSFEYIKYVLETLPNIDTKDLSALDALLPWSSSIPSQCRQNCACANEPHPGVEQPADPVAV